MPRTTPGLLRPLGRVCPPTTSEDLRAVRDRAPHRCWRPSPSSDSCQGPARSPRSRGTRSAPWPAGRRRPSTPRSGWPSGPVATSSITLNAAARQLGCRTDLRPRHSCGVNQGTASSRYVSLHAARRAGLLRAARVIHQRFHRRAGEEDRNARATRSTPSGESLDLELGRGARPSWEQRARVLRLPRRRAEAERPHPRHRHGEGATVPATFELQSGTSVGLPPLRAPRPAVHQAGPTPARTPGRATTAAGRSAFPPWLGTDDGDLLRQAVLEAPCRGLLARGRRVTALPPPAPAAVPRRLDHRGHGRHRRLQRPTTTTLTRRHRAPVVPSTASTTSSPTVCSRSLHLANASTTVRGSRSSSSRWTVRRPPSSSGTSTWRFP